MISVYEMMENVATYDRDGLWDARNRAIWLMKTKCLMEMKTNRFPFRCVNTWNSLKKEVVEAKSIHEFNIKPDKR